MILYGMRNNYEEGQSTQTRHFVISPYRGTHLMIPPIVKLINWVAIHVVETLWMLPSK